MVEVTIAIGVAAFALVAVFGLIPVGLNTFHQSMDTSVGTQIVQRVINEVQQTDFQVLVGNHTQPFLQSDSARYFDSQGNELPDHDEAVFLVNTRITPITSIPSPEGSDAGNPNLATITIQIASKANGVVLERDPATLLWHDNRVAVSTYSALVSRNQ